MRSGYYDSGTLTRFHGHVDTLIFVQALENPAIAPENVRLERIGDMEQM